MTKEKSQQTFPDYIDANLSTGDGWFNKWLESQRSATYYRNDFELLVMGDLSLTFSPHGSGSGRYGMLISQLGNFVKNVTEKSRFFLELLDNYAPISKFKYQKENNNYRICDDFSAEGLASYQSFEPLKVAYIASWKRFYMKLFPVVNSACVLLFLLCMVALVKGGLVTLTLLTGVVSGAGFLLALTLCNVLAIFLEYRRLRRLEGSKLSTAEMIDLFGGEAKTIEVISDPDILNYTLKPLLSQKMDEVNLECTKKFSTMHKNGSQ